MILVDTSVFIDFFRGNQSPTVSYFDIILRRAIPFGITSFTYQEILQGAKSETEFEDLQKYLSTQRFYYPKHPVNSYAEAARIYFLCRQKGMTVRSTIDCLIAQIAMESDLILLHSDGDFELIAKVVPLKNALELPIT